MSVRLPSGLTGNVRGLSGKDGRYLTNEKVIQDDEVEDFIFRHCWKTIDEGPYPLNGGDPDWSNVLVGDRFYALIAVRIATYPGKEYPLKVQCSCRKRPFEWEVSLEELLERKTKSLSPEDAKLFREGNRFPAKLPGVGTPFVFKLKTGGDAKRTQKIIEAKKTGPKRQQERQNLLVESLASYVVSIEGIEKPTRDKLFDFLEELPLGVLDDLMPLIQAHDCGVDTTIETRCPHCRKVVVVNLPFGRAFFLPSSTAAQLRPDAATEEEEAGEMAEEAEEIAAETE